MLEIVDKVEPSKAASIDAILADGDASFVKSAKSASL